MPSRRAPPNQNSFSSEEEHFIIHLKEVVGGLNWDDLAARYIEKFPDNPRSKGGLQVHYSRSLQPGRDRRPSNLSSSKSKKVKASAKLKAELDIKDSDDEDIAVNDASETEQYQSQSQSNSTVIKLRMRIKREPPRRVQRPRRAVTASMKNYADYRQDSLSPFEPNDSLMSEPATAENIDEVTKSPEHEAAEALLGLSSPDNKRDQDVQMQHEVIESVEVDDMAPPPAPTERHVSSSPPNADDVERSASQARQEELLRSKRSYGKSPSITLVQSQELQSERDISASFTSTKTALNTDLTAGQPEEVIGSIFSDTPPEDSDKESAEPAVTQEPHDTLMDNHSDASETPIISRTRGIKLKLSAPATTSKTKKALPTPSKPQPADIKKSTRVRKAPARLLQHDEDEAATVQATEGMVPLLYLR